VVTFLSRNASNFTCSYLDLKLTFLDEKPRTPAYRSGDGKGNEEEGEGIKGFLIHALF